MLLPCPNFPFFQSTLGKGILSLEQVMITPALRQKLIPHALLLSVSCEPGFIGDGALHLKKNQFVLLKFSAENKAVQANRHRRFLMKIQPEHMDNLHGEQACCNLLSLGSFQRYFKVRYSLWWLAAMLHLRSVLSVSTTTELM